MSSNPAVVIDAEVVPALDAAAAQRLDTKIRLLTNTIIETWAKLSALVEEAKQGQIHQALGYSSWTAYLADVFTVQVRLDRDQRRELVGYLSGEGMSQRTISAVVGASVGTVNSDLAGVQNRTSDEPGRDPDLDDLVAAGIVANEQEAAEVLAMGDIPDEQFEAALVAARAQEDMSRGNVIDLARRGAEQKSTGADGKTYSRKAARPHQKSKPKLSPIEKQRKMLMQITNFTDQVREANSIRELDPGITPDEANRLANALNANLQPVFKVYELLRARAADCGGDG